jgi:hypothetical protein
MSWQSSHLKTIANLKGGLCQTVAPFYLNQNKDG